MLHEAKSNCESNGIDNVEFRASGAGPGCAAACKDASISYTAFSSSSTFRFGRGEQLFRRLLGHLEDDGVAAVHFLCWKQPRWPVLRALRDQLPFASRMWDALWRKPSRMEMNAYDLNRLLADHPRDEGAQVPCRAIRRPDHAGRGAVRPQTAATRSRPKPAAATAQPCRRRINPTHCASFDFAWVARHGLGSGHQGRHGGGRLRRRALQGRRRGARRQDRRAWTLARAGAPHHRCRRPCRGARLRGRPHPHGRAGFLGPAGLLLLLPRRHQRGDGQLRLHHRALQGTGRRSRVPQPGTRRGHLEGGHARPASTGAGRPSRSSWTRSTPCPRASTTLATSATRRCAPT